MSDPNLRRIYADKLALLALARRIGAKLANDYTFTAATCVAALATFATLASPKHEIIGEFPSALAYLPPAKQDPEKAKPNPWLAIEAAQEKEFKAERKAASIEKARAKIRCEKYGSDCPKPKGSARKAERERARELCELFDVGCKASPWKRRTY